MTTAKATRSRLYRGTKRFGYTVAIIVNAVLLVVVNNLLEWDLLSFLTEDFELLLPLISISLAASIVANAIYLWYDAPWFKSVSQIVLGAIGLAVTIRTYQVFPFDFSAYSFNWSALTRVVLVIAMIGISVGIIAELAKLARNAERSTKQSET